MYAVGHASLSRFGEFLAAVLAAGPGAALSHESCAELFEVRRWPAREIHVSAPRRRRIEGVITHRTPLGPLDVVIYKGIPSRTSRGCSSISPTSPTRTRS